ncbi:MAG: ATP-dependent helicase HrpB [Planctomycetota bacterium]
MIRCQTPYQRINLQPYVLTPTSLPIDDVLAELCEAVRANQAVLLRAPTGAGKTTRVPGALLDAGLAGNGEVIVLEPRRLAARAAARRTASERNAKLGGEVGYQVRFDSKRSRDTRITFVTEGLFLRRLQGDPFLEGVGLVIFDEFHERNLDGDLSLALARRVQLDVREDLKLVVMSATLNTGPLLEFLGQPPLVESQGRSYPVEIEYLSGRQVAERGGPSSETVRDGIRRALDSTTGNVLVFHPGVGEIKRTASLIDSAMQQAGIQLFQLYGDQSPEEQDRALKVQSTRAVYLATNVAETSLTLPNITAVVDTGLSRTLKHDPSRGLNQLTLGPISNASAQQRAGRAGRTAPGRCLRLWTEHEDRTRPPEEEPEVRRVDVAGALLELIAFGESTPTSFPWFEAPPQAAIEVALKLLVNIGAIELGASGKCRLLEIGKQISKLPLHPRLARLLVEGATTGVSFEAATCAAMLSERSPFKRGARVRHSSTSHFDSDLVDQLHALMEFEDSGRRDGDLNPVAARNLLRVRDQLLRSIERDKRGGRQAVNPDEAIARALLCAYPDRLARRRAAGDERALLIDGRGVRVARESSVKAAELFICIDAFAGARETIVSHASEVRREWLDKTKIHTEVSLAFDQESLRVVAQQITRFGTLELDSRPATLKRCAASTQALVDAAALDLERALPLRDKEFINLVARIHCLNEWMPDLELPRIDDAFLIELLPQLCGDKLSFAELDRAPLKDAVQSALDWKQLEALNRHAPERITVPSGNNIRLTYEEGRPPILAARIQELFGMQSTPRIAGGRVTLLMHLLAPNMRPQQVTDDLESFWKTTYGEVRKDLRRRYPKHDWPENPLTAKARQRRR